ncbi:PREDICTED: protein transport protein Sec24-like At4g32640-like [Chrysochloris asiatica]|uniref:Protein transport protein Sec24-like At4g32640-like n=1 Tax=Chrysochloris asiatica TaxID=185453 RepID=A0A9B0WIH4_CHRAS|nr:PREDICTED: protein transport protein Sec24-like At4g32640-like [Chrysochloris asiatica]
MACAGGCGYPPRGSGTAAASGGGSRRPRPSPPPPDARGPRPRPSPTTPDAAPGRGPQPTPGSWIERPPPPSVGFYDPAPSRPAEQPSNGERNERDGTPVVRVFWPVEKRTGSGGRGAEALSRSGPCENGGSECKAKFFCKPSAKAGGGGGEEGARDRAECSFGAAASLALKRSASQLAPQLSQAPRARRCSEPSRRRAAARLPPLPASAPAPAPASRPPAPGASASSPPPLNTSAAPLRVWGRRD